MPVPIARCRRPRRTPPRRRPHGTARPCTQADAERRGRGLPGGLDEPVASWCGERDAALRRAGPPPTSTGRPRPTIEVWSGTCGASETLEFKDEASQEPTTPLSPEGHEHLDVVMPMRAPVSRRVGTSGRAALTPDSTSIPRASLANRAWRRTATAGRRRPPLRPASWPRSQASTSTGVRTSIEPANGPSPVKPRRAGALAGGGRLDGSASTRSAASMPPGDERCRGPPCGLAAAARPGGGPGPRTRPAPPVPHGEDGAEGSVTHARLRGSGRRRSMWPASESTSRPSTRICTAAMAGRFTVRALTIS